MTQKIRDRVKELQEQLYEDLDYYDYGMRSVDKLCTTIEKLCDVVESIKIDKVDYRNEYVETNRTADLKKALKEWGDKV